RHILWGYMKELRNVPAPPCLCNKYSYAGCVSLPRALYLRGDKLFQLPLPELTALRSDVAVHVSQVALTHGSPFRLRGVRGLHLDIELAVSPGSARRTAVLLHSWRPRGRGAAALVYDWTSRRLYVVFDAMRPSRQALWRGTAAPRTQQQHQPPEPPTHKNLQHQQQEQQERHASFSATFTAATCPTSSIIFPDGHRGRVQLDCYHRYIRTNGLPELARVVCEASPHPKPYCGGAQKRSSSRCIFTR
ncbi:hypothetical protein Vafri_4157, partial [Volvox africanus]